MGTCGPVVSGHMSCPSVEFLTAYMSEISISEIRFSVCIFETAACRSKISLTALLWGAQNDHDHTWNICSDLAVARNFP